MKIMSNTVLDHCSQDESGTIANLTDWLGLRHPTAEDLKAAEELEFNRGHDKKYPAPG